MQGHDFSSSTETKMCTTALKVVLWFSSILFGEVVKDLPPPTCFLTFLLKGKCGWHWRRLETCIMWFFIWDFDFAQLPWEEKTVSNMRPMAEMAFFLSQKWSKQFQWKRHWNYWEADVLKSLFTRYVNG